MDTNRKFKISSLFTFILAVLSYFFFMHAKHDPALSKVNPFAEDPYDAVGSFSIQAATFLGILCLVRAFRAPRANAPLRVKESLFLRAQMATILSVAVTLTSDAVAMIRHPSLWFGLPAGYRLLVLLTGMAVLTAIMGVSIRRSALSMDLQATPAVWMRAIAVSLVTVLALFLYPQTFRHGLIGALFTVLFGALILFASTWAWTTALVSGLADVSTPEGAPAFSSSSQRKYGWGIVILAGILIGLFFVAGEASEGSGIPHAKLALVVSAYIGLETAGIMIGYGFLAKPLGLFRGGLQ
ncbi:MAG TPA: hypothetical protein VKS20_04710 [Candidatus Acidoferrales bacterium]|nr:hypothetical protein [Candidatus Acidoferrales bacterium]